MNYHYIKYLSFSLILSCCCWLASCVDDDLKYPAEEELTKLPNDEYALRFKINLETMTRDGNISDFEKLEDYIDPQRLHVLFFYGSEYKKDIYGIPTNEADPKYNTLIKKFSPDELTLVPVSNTGSNISKEWYVHIPILENDEEFGNILRDNDFKVAVLANWPSSKDNIDMDGYDSSTQTPGDNIHKLHHQPKPDLVNSGDDPYKKDNTYSFLFEGLEGDKRNLGTYVNWVKDGKTVEEARTYILNDYGPGVLQDEGNKEDIYGNRKYDELWLRWNFTDAYNYLPEGERFSVNGEGYNYKVQYNPFDYDAGSENSKSEFWAQQNFKEFYNWFWKERQKVGDEGEPVVDEDNKPIMEWVRIDNLSKLVDFDFYSGVSNPENDYEFHRGYFKFLQNNDGNDNEKAYIRTDFNIEGKTLTGVVLPKVGYDSNNKIDRNVIIVKIPNNGELNVKWGSLNNGTSATIKLETRNHIDDTNAKSAVQGYGAYNVISTTKNWAEFSTYSATEKKGNEIKITGDAEYLFIYTEGNNPIVIYEIEYISSYYLHNIDNVGKKLSQEEGMLIPMYGLQLYNSLGSFWKPGTVFDISNFNYLGPQPYPESEEEDAKIVEPYRYKSVSLIRSVAKVELKIPKIYQAHHIYLRSMNRRGRSEPVDVSTPTDQMWDKTLEEGVSSPSHEDECHDWSKIFLHDPFYDNTHNETESVQYGHYRSKLAWYYGNWSESNKVGKGEDAVEIYDSWKKTYKSEYPQLMNAIIQRTDFTEFIESGSDSYYDRYVLYVPEKYVDDPGSTGDESKMETTTPKVCHIEFRGDTDPFMNVDDNWCYRIYFTQGGFFSNEGNNKYPTFSKPTPGASDDQTWENYYEQNVYNLKNHWPIIRNHYYRFTVIDALNRIVVAKLEVLPWKKVEDNKYEW